MKKIIAIFGVLILLLLGVVVALPFLIDPNQFRPRLEAELGKALGREVKMGDLKLALTAGSVAAADLSISDDAAFSKTPFLTAKLLTIGVDLKELIFSKKLIVTGIEIQQPDIALIQSTSGNWNFSSIGSKTAETKPAETPSSGPPPDLSVKLLKIVDGRISLLRGGEKNPQALDKVNVSVTDFSPASAFPFTFTAAIQGGGQISLDGKAGPIDTADAAVTPFTANLKVDKLDVVHTGFVPVTTGFAGLISINGTVTAANNKFDTKGDIKAEQLKLAKNGKPAKIPVDFNFALAHNASTHAGVLSHGDVHVGKARASLTGSYSLKETETLLDMKLAAPGMEMDELTEMLPALAVELPNGSSLHGGKLVANFTVVGPSDKLDIKGALAVKNTQLANFDLGSKMSTIAKIAGIKLNPNTDFENVSSDVHSNPQGTELQNISVIAPDLGEIAGAGTVSPTNILDFKLRAKLKAGGIFSALASNVPFSIEGPATEPKFVPDIKGAVGNGLKTLAKDPLAAGAKAVEGVKALKDSPADIGKAATGIMNLFNKKKSTDGN
jgi:AsmA protein